jgi:hypothetical protein
MRHRRAAGTCVVNRPADVDDFLDELLADDIGARIVLCARSSQL